MPDVQEILNGLREGAFDVAEAGLGPLESCSPTPVVPLADAEAAVHAAADAHNWRTVHKCPSCNRYFDSPSVCSDGTHTVEQEERVPSGVWPDQSAQHGVLLDEIRELHQENERLRAASPDERLREALTFYADAGNYVGGEVGWWGVDHRGEPVWCMDFGSIARNALAADREAPDKPQEHTQECADAMFMHHAATGGDMECTCRAAADREKPEER